MDDQPLNRSIPKIKDLDIYQHLKHNILNSENNCKDSLSEDTFYCFTCKKSTCPECNDINEHTNHFLIPKKKFLTFDKNFFEQIEKNINNQNLNLDYEKKKFIKDIEDTVNFFHKQLDEIKNKKINEVNDLYYKINQNMKELWNNYKETKEQLNSFYKKYQNFFSIGEKNKDDENVIFLINFELMNICNIKNDQMVNSLENQKNKLLEYNHELSLQTEIIKKEIENILNQKTPYERFEDFFWDIKQRIKSYDNNISTVQKSIFDILKAKGSYESLNELVQLMDSKNKRGKNYIFDQNYFTSNEPLSPEKKSSKKLEKNTSNPDLRKVPKHMNSSKNMKIRSSSKNKIMSPTRTMSNLSSTDVFAGLRTGYPSKINLNTTDKLLSNFGVKAASDINLDTKVKQSFFAYSIINTYNKNFSSQPRKSFDSQARVYEDYYKRLFNLKEAAKPIAGTCDILIIDSLTNTAVRKKIHLEKEKHGYAIFPQGSRHLLINDKLYITGGVDSLGNPINIVLLYELQNDTISRIDNMIKPHSYHSIEYIENYDCFVVIGGEKNKYCEIFDLFTNKWKLLPCLNYPRSNTNIYFDQYTSDIYVLFGMNGAISTQRNFSDIIEVLELNDISSGWIKIDYLKPGTLNLKQSYVHVAPFTRDALLINGGKEPKNTSKLYALFLMHKNEVVKVSREILEELKLEESKMKSYSNGLINLGK